MSTGAAPAVSVESWILPGTGSPPLTLSVDYGDSVALTGPNGSGKSTLLRAISGLHAGAAGFIRIDGQQQTPKRIIGEIGVQIDKVPLHGWLSVRENLELAAQHGSLTRDAIVSAALRRFGAEGFADARVRTLSQGMTRRAELAAASINQPRIVLLDEPTDALDADALLLLRAWMAELAENRCAVIIASHSGPEREWCDREVPVSK